MDSRFIYHIDKFIIFLLGKKNENDPDQQIYNKLLELDGEELDVWVHEKLKKYIICAGEYFEFEENISKSIFKIWYMTISYWKNDPLIQPMKLYEIYNQSDPDYVEELKTIKLKLHLFQGSRAKNYDEIPNWKLCVIADYMEMYIMNMNSFDLKSYIIQLVEPVEIR
jgi:hypothetical protein